MAFEQNAACAPEITFEHPSFNALETFIEMRGWASGMPRTGEWMNARNAA
jgi:hypothetical protein